MGGTLTSTTETTIWWKHWTERAKRGEFGVYILGSHLASIPTYMLTGGLATSPTLWGSNTPARLSSGAAVGDMLEEAGWNEPTARSPVPTIEPRPETR